MTTANLQQLIQQDTRATARVLQYLDELGVSHSGQISGATLASVCGVDSRTWRRWVDGTRTMPAMARRLLCQVGGIEQPWVSLPIEGRIPKALQHSDGDKVLVRLSSGQENVAYWRQGDTAYSGGYVDFEGDQIEFVSTQIVAVLPT